MPKSKKKVSAKTAKTKIKPAKKLTAKQQQEKRSQAARKAALARWSKERPLSKAALKKQTARIPTSELTIEHYADRPNPELSWAAAILKRQLSTKRQRREAALIFGQNADKTKNSWRHLSPEQRTEIARRGGQRRWEIWREEKALLEGRNSSISSSSDTLKPQTSPKRRNSASTV